MDRRRAHARARAPRRPCVRSHAAPEAGGCSRVRTSRSKAAVVAHSSETSTATPAPNRRRRRGEEAAASKRRPRFGGGASRDRARALHALSDLRARPRPSRRDSRARRRRRARGGSLRAEPTLRDRADRRDGAPCRNLGGAGQIGERTGGLDAAASRRHRARVDRGEVRCSSLLEARGLANVAGALTEAREEEERIGECRAGCTGVLQEARVFADDELA